MARTLSLSFSRTQTRSHSALHPPIFKFPLSIQVLGIPLGQRLTNSLPVSWSPIPCSRPSSMSCLEDSQVFLTTPCLSDSSFSHHLATPKDPKSMLSLGGGGVSHP